MDCVIETTYGCQVFNSYKFEDTKRIMRGCKWQTIQWPKEKGQTMIYKTLHRKLKIEQHEPY